MRSHLHNPQRKGGAAGRACGGTGFRRPFLAAPDYGSYDTWMTDVNEFRAERAKQALGQFDLEHDSIENAVLAVMVDALHLAEQEGQTLNLVRLATAAAKERPSGLRI